MRVKRKGFDKESMAALGIFSAGSPMYKVEGKILGVGDGFDEEDEGFDAVFSKREASDFFPEGEGAARRVLEASPTPLWALTKPRLARAMHTTFFPRAIVRGVEQTRAE